VGEFTHLQAAQYAPWPSNPSVGARFQTSRKDEYDKKHSRARARSLNIAADGFEYFFEAGLWIHAHG